MQLSLDIGSFILGLATAIVIPLIVWFMSKEARDKEARLQAYGELKEAFEIHTALTAPNVVEALANVEDDDQARRFLVALHQRSSYRFKEFSVHADIPADLEQLIRDELARINDALPAETAAAQEAFDEKATRTRPKSADVQSKILAFAEHLAGTSVTRDQPSPVVAELADLFADVRVSRGGQGVDISLPDGKNTIWFAGSGTGELPAGVVHGGTKGCQLNSVKAGAFKKQLTEHNQDGKQLAVAFVAQLRALASRDATCTCGVPLTFPARVPGA